MSLESVGVREADGDRQVDFFPLFYVKLSSAFRLSALLAVPAGLAT